MISHNLDLQEQLFILVLRLIFISTQRLGPLGSRSETQLLELGLEEFTTRQIPDLQTRLRNVQVSRSLQSSLLRDVQTLTKIRLSSRQGISLVDPSVLIEQTFLSHTKVSLVLVILLGLLISLLTVFQSQCLFFAHLLLNNESSTIELNLTLHESQTGH